MFFRKENINYREELKATVVWRFETILYYKRNLSEPGKDTAIYTLAMAGNCVGCLPVVTAFGGAAAAQQRGF